MNSTWRRLAAALAVVSVALVLAVAGCSSPSSTTGTGGGGTGNTGVTVTVTEKNFKFIPSTVTAPLSSKVVFQNQDTVEHHVVVGTDDLGIQAPGQSVTWPASTAGNYALKCLIHPTMVGKVVVGSPSPSSPVIGGGSGAPAGGTGY